MQRLNLEDYRDYTFQYPLVPEKGSARSIEVETVCQLLRSAACCDSLGKRSCRVSGTIYLFSNLLLIVYFHFLWCIRQYDFGTILLPK
jgi:hypothetical protein